ncbi:MULTISPECIES: transcription termination/antitermination protein NusG [unclassified Rhizobium]|uniref:transcription termination/antitermination protein NusG n=1 Tax=unclassified Rhizobium TaxID=2613769 RepID=UPI0038299564
MMHNVKIYAASNPVDPKAYDLTRFEPLFDQMRDRKRIKATMLSMATGEQPGKREWFVVETKHKQEKTVEDALHKAGVKVFLPLESAGQQVVRGKVVADYMRPLLPGYVLVNIVYSPAAVCGICRVDGVAGFVGGMISPHRVSDEEVYRFKAFDEAPDREHCMQFSRGDTVRFTFGPFVKLSGTICKMRKGRSFGGERMATGAVVKLELFGKTHLVDAPLAFFEKL